MRFGLLKLDRYIIGKFITTFVFAILILAVISCVIDYSEKVDNIVQKKAPLIEVLNYYKNFIPHISALLFPLFIFIATIFFTSKLAYNSEIIAILSSGVSFSRFLRPYVIGAVILGIVALVFNHYLIPIANKQRVAFEDKYINDGNYTYPGENVHLALSKEKYIYLQYIDYNAGTGTHFAEEILKGTELTDKTMAEQVEYDSVQKEWLLKDVWVRHNDTLTETMQHFNELRKKYPFKPAELRNNEAMKEGLTTPQLRQFVAVERQRGRDNLNFFYVELYRRTAQPVAGLILTLIGACIACQKIRGGSGLHLALGIAISAIYVMFMQLFTTFSTKASMNPLLAVWIPNIIFAGIAYWLYRRQAR
ncbi:MAG: YjgP/YjgQ family permease [Chitinophagia bacterium]|nr:YjgP/YjgQ family permease [Chitinophagia bacterium]